MTDAAHGGAKPASAAGGKKEKGPSVNDKPTLRQHPKHFYDNFVTKGISHEMSQQRRMNDDAPEHDATASAREVNHRKLYELPGDANATNPPYHITGDNERVRDAGTYCRTQQRLRAALVAADANRDGFVTLKEFSSAVQQAADRFLAPQPLMQQFKLLDPDGNGKISIEDAVAASVRTLSTRPSQRQSLGIGNVLAWNDGADMRDPGASYAALTGGATDPHRYYGLTGSERIATSPQREALLPGLSPRVAGMSTSARLRQIDSQGGTAAPLIRGSSSSILAGGSPTAASPNAASPRGGSGGGGARGSPRSLAPSPRKASPRSTADRPRSYAAAPAGVGGNRTTTLRAQYRQQEEQLSAALEASYFPKAAAQSPRFRTPRGANLAPRPGVHIEGVRPVVE